MIHFLCACCTAVVHMSPLSGIVEHVKECRRCSNHKRHAGVLDALAAHEGEDLARVEALLRMVPPLHSALDSYRERCGTAANFPEHAMMLEAAVQSL